ncbi:MAG: pilus assembly protein TadG-related protein [Rhizobiaceae bacterium]
MKHFLSTFFRDCRGNVAIIASLLLLPMLMLAGVGIDYSRISSAEGNLQSTVDNAAFDIARLFSKGPHAARELEALINANSGRNTAQARIRVHRDKIRIEARDVIETPLLSTIGQPETVITASIEVDGNKSTGTSNSDRPKKKTTGQKDSREVARLRRYENVLRENLQRLRQASNRLPYQTRKRLEKQLRDQIREVRTRIRQLPSA